MVSLAYQRLCVAHYARFYDMAYHTLEYDVYVIKGAQGCPDLWTWRHWEPWAKALNPFATSPRGKAAVRCLQYSADPRKMVSFGKLYWEEKSHQRWTHNSPTNGDDSTPWKFLSLEAWAPSWTVCEKERVPPEFYFSLRNPDCFRSAGNSAPFVVCAIPSEPDSNRATELESALASLLKTFPSSVFAHKKRPWGISSLGADSFTYSIQDMRETVLSGATDFDRMRKPFDEDLLPETWRRIKATSAK
jgi:hypothetical protein